MTPLFASGYGGSHSSPCSSWASSLPVGHEMLIACSIINCTLALAIIWLNHKRRRPIALAWGLIASLNVVSLLLHTGVI